MESSDMKKKVVIIVIVILILLGSIITYNIIKERNTDAYKFKVEYESLNNSKNENNKKYNAINIDKHNPIKYINAKEAIDIIKNKTGIIYFGANWCPWCRNAVPVLFDVAKDYEYKTIYYLNMDTVKNKFEIKNGKLVKTVKEKKYYYELLDSLDGHLKEGTCRGCCADKYLRQYPHRYRPLLPRPGFPALCRYQGLSPVPSEY